MLKLLNGLICLFSLLLSIETKAADNLTFSQYKKSSDVPSAFCFRWGKRTGEQILPG